MAGAVELAFAADAPLVNLSGGYGTNVIEPPAPSTTWPEKFSACALHQ